MSLATFDERNPFGWTFHFSGAGDVADQGLNPTDTRTAHVDLLRVGITSDVDEVLVFRWQAGAGDEATFIEVKLSPVDAGASFAFADVLELLGLTGVGFNIPPGDFLMFGLSRRSTSAINVDIVALGGWI